MHIIKTAVFGICLLAVATALPSAASAQNVDNSVQAELALAHDFLDPELDAGMRMQLGSIQTVLQGYPGFAAAEMAALEQAYAEQLEFTITEAQDMLAKAASDAFTADELRQPHMISDARWDAVISPMQDQLILLGATLGAKAVIAGCGSIARPSEACTTFLKVSRDFLDGGISVDEIRQAAGG